MPIIELKKQLHEIIDAIQDEQMLSALLLIMLPKEAYLQDIALDDAQIKELEDREERVNSGEAKTLTFASFKSHMRSKYGI